MKTTFFGLFAKRTLRQVVGTCAFCFIAGLSFADDLKICSECGREGEADATMCSACGAVFQAPSASETGDKKSDTPQEKATSAMSAAAKDVAEARRVAEDNPALALVLYRNAQALLASESGANFNDKAGKTLAEELKKARASFNADCAPAVRQAALVKAQHMAEDYFRSAGRTPMGRAWVPLDWPQRLSPQAVAAVRHALQPVCASCGGDGFDPCRKCGGAGRVPCDEPGCKNGWISRKPTDSLVPKNDIMIRDKCPVCKGTAFKACKECASRGVIPCKKCGGTGEAPICKGCQGTGLEPCRDCQKSPKGKDCVLCGGTGEMPCKKCGGDGRTAK